MTPLYPLTCWRGMCFQWPLASLLAQQAVEGFQGLHVADEQAKHQTGHAEAYKQDNRKIMAQRRYKN